MAMSRGAHLHLQLGYQCYQCTRVLCCGSCNGRRWRFLVMSSPTAIHSHNLNCTPCPRCLNGPEATSSLGGCCTMFRQIIEFPFLEILDLGPELDMKKWVKTGKNGSKFFLGCHICYIMTFSTFFYF